MLGPLLFEGLTEATGTWLSYFLFMAAGVAPRTNVARNADSSWILINFDIFWRDFK